MRTQSQIIGDARGRGWCVTSDALVLTALLAGALLTLLAGGAQ